MINILVTAVGSELAFTIIKAIKLMQQPYRLIGCDIYNEVVGKYWCNKFYTVPLAKDEANYIESLKRIVKDERINIVIPTADLEFFILSKHQNSFKNEFACNIFINEYEEIIRFNDKWLAYQWYENHKLPTPKTFLADNLSELKNEITALPYPMLIKPRQGGGSRTIFKVSSFEEVVKYQPIVPDPIIQEYLIPDDEEYTAGTYRTSVNEVLTIVMKRKLKFGMTNTAETVNNPELDKFCKHVILNTNLKGSNNIQFRVTKDGPKILEINPRFSGTTGIRANFGFNDVEMWINEVIFGKEITQPVINHGFVLRFMEEQYHFN
ncbi:ATP-grasp domain-containing protein [bacterium]|nr:MAG: ATP-grasp domain-containing protein [bacterium]